MSKHTTKLTCEVLVLGRWVVASRGWSAVERDAFQRSAPARADVRFVPARLA